MIKWTEGHNRFRSLLNGSDYVQPRQYLIHFPRGLPNIWVLRSPCSMPAGLIRSPFTTRSGAPNYQRSALKFASD